MHVKDLFRMELNIFQRLVSERERLGLNKAEMAAVGGVAQPTYLRYETGDRVPDGEFYAKIAAHGADVLYILTGQRSQVISPQALLPEGDRILLDNYHAAPLGVQAGVKTTLGAFSAQTGSGKRKAG
jgi:transcriptional regulator with XRE-family HTH domain